MRVNGHFLRRLTNENGNLEVSFEVSSYFARESLKSLEKGKEYRIEINEIKSKRSIEQNNMLWKLLHELNKKLDGEEKGEWDLYIQALEKTGAKYEYIAALPESEEMLKKSFRAIKKLNQFQHNGRIFNQYKVYYGSSTFNTKEMNELLDRVLDMCAEAGIEYEIDY